MSPAPAPKPPLEPWTWHALGGLLVVEGEVDQPTELILKGKQVYERRHVDLGPVRWEMYRPPPGSTAELRTGAGELLATWDFDHPQAAVPPVVPPKPEKKERKKPEQVKPEPKKIEPKKPAPKTPEPKKIEPAKPAPKPSEPKKPAPKPPEPKKAESKKPEPKKPAPKPLPPPKPVVKPPEPKKTEPRKIEPPKLEPKKTAPPKPEPKKPQPPKPEPKQPQPPKPLPLPPPVLNAAGVWPGAGEGLNVQRGPRSGRQVCLTFDGGSNAEVALDVLEILKARNIQTTFFLTGTFIRKFPEIVRRIAADGHEIGNHTQNHPHFAPTGLRDPKWTRERIQGELLAADQAFFNLLGRPMDPLWRAPYGEHTSEIRKWAEELGYRHVGWSEGADTLDWATRKERKLYRTGDAILDRLHNRMERQDGEGLIVLMHLGSERPVEDRPARVLGPFIDRALAAGWTFVRVGDYVQSSGKPAWDRARRTAQLR
ncbi:MAG: polysaccharide deacetylase family protein [Holophaga sp.]|nr:polysaccharide deacetylase family protein [Holophaga sp.]